MPCAQGVFSWNERIGNTWTNPIKSKNQTTKLLLNVPLIRMRSAWQMLEAKQLCPKTPSLLKVSFEKKLSPVSVTPWNYRQKLMCISWKKVHSFNPEGTTLKNRLQISKLQYVKVKNKRVIAEIFYFYHFILLWFHRMILSWEFKN